MREATSATEAPNPTPAAHPWVAAGRDAVRFGVAYGPRTDWAECRAFVQLVEALDFDSYWVMDHPASGLDCWTTLAALAGTTVRLRLGPLVSCVYYRSPALLARMAADIDRLSDGRLVLGLGMGNHRQEFARLGLRFPSVSDRLQAVEETVRTVLRFWGATPLAEGDDQFRAAEDTLRPGPVQRPRVPLLIAGGGERVTLRQVARYAEASNFSPHRWAGSAFGPEDVRRKLEALRRHCEVLGRPYESVLRTHAAVPVVVADSRAAVRAKLGAIPPRLRDAYRSSTVAGTPEEVVAYYRELIDAGINYVIAGVYGNDVETVRHLAEQVVPALSTAKALPTLTCTPPT